MTSQFQVISQDNAAVMTLQNAEVGYNNNSDGLISTGMIKAFPLHHHHCQIIS